MAKYNLSNKEKKDLVEFNKVAKDSFKVYYVNNLCEAFAPREVYSKHDRYSFVKDQTSRIGFIFTQLGISGSSVIVLNHLVISNAMTKLSAIESIETIGSKLYLRLLEIKDANKEKLFDFITEQNDGSILVELGGVKPFDGKVKEVYKYSIPSQFSGHVEVDERTMEDILDKKEVILTNNNYDLIVLKPLFPGISSKTKLSCLFTEFPDNDELFIANFTIVREQIISYHKFIGIVW